MMTTRFVMTSLGVILISAAALAQTNPPTPNTTAANPAASGKFLSQVEPEKWRTFKLKGLDVYNSNNEHVGDIRELLQDRGGKIEAVVIGVGGFLGMGEHNVALPYDEIQWVEKGSSTTGSTTDTTRTTTPNNPNESVRTTGTVTRTTNVPGPSYPDHAVIKITREQLKAAPAFNFSD
ncbi:PRC-barrel domain-containing protein [Microvirga sp. TS319]|uniref:PRC-barrel domain-containing protein n=1 Tax=Microvirga sp. TS319 TaxID=3241165 RepID=UPI00351A5095